MRSLIRGSAHARAIALKISTNWNLIVVSRFRPNTCRKQPLNVASSTNLTHMYSKIRTAKLPPNIEPSNKYSHGAELPSSQKDGVRAADIMGPLALHNDESLSRFLQTLYHRPCAKSTSQHI